MNDRIRKMAIEADAWCDKYYFGDLFYDIEWEKKFAELIVQECVGIIETQRVSVGNSPSGEMAAKWTMNALRDTRDEIKEHFGVK